MRNHSVRPEQNIRHRRSVLSSGIGSVTSHPQGRYSTKVGVKAGQRIAAKARNVARHKRHLRG